MTNPNPTAALDALLGLGEGFSPKRIDEAHDYLRLLGVVVGQLALLDVATEPTTEKTAAAKVAAARALMTLKETPEAIAERLRRSPFADLRADQLERIVQLVKQGITLHAAITQVKESPDGRSP